MMESGGGNVREVWKKIEGFFLRKRIDFLIEIRLEDK